MEISVDEEVETDRVFPTMPLSAIIAGVGLKRTSDLTITYNTFFTAHPILRFTLIGISHSSASALYAMKPASRNELLLTAICPKEGRETKLN